MKWPPEVVARLTLGEVVTIIDSDPMVMEERKINGADADVGKMLFESRWHGNARKPWQTSG